MSSVKEFTSMRWTISGTSVLVLILSFTRMSAYKSHFVLFNTNSLNGHTTGYHQQTQNLELHAYKINSTM